MRFHVNTAFAILLCVSSQAIRVPITWSYSEDDPNSSTQAQATANIQEKPEIPIPLEYFEYTAQKPQFAVDIAKFHGVKNPENHFSAYPVRPYGVTKPQLGQHQILNENRPVFNQFQNYIKLNEPEKNYGDTFNLNYDTFHPYKEEEYGLRQIYKDPVLGKIRNDIKNSQTRLQKYENEAGKPNIESGEYLESLDETDRKQFPHRYNPAPYEIHRPQRRPVYYRPPPKSSREHILNQKFRHPWNQYEAKIRPLHYQPLKNHIHRLRHNHAIKYDDERNEYPQPPPPEAYSQPSDGYDIYQRGKEKFIKLRDNVDESINSAIKENRPTVYQKLELQNNGNKVQTQIGDDDEQEDEFVPIKNYAQVRKTETYRHLPRAAAFADADSFDDIRNAPRLREAIKSTKAQTVYTEEGYEDAAYDHAGEQKHAHEAEAHGGFLKEKEISGGQYKTPEQAAKYQEAEGNEYRDAVEHGKKWKNNNKEEEDADDFSEDETADYIEEDVYKQVNGERNKREESNEKSEPSEKLQQRESDPKSEKVEYEDEEDGSESDDEIESDLPEKTTSSKKDSSDKTIEPHEINKRETVKAVTRDKEKNASNFKVPEINFNSTYLSDAEFSKIGKLKLVPDKEDIRKKYPYYFKNLKQVNKDSPLRYAENLRFIPNKSLGGTEFYDSRSKFACPEVDEEVDAIPEKLKKHGNPDGNSDENAKGEADFDSQKQNPRLGGLGDKIDCFKAKFFGENPLDSPFFKEEIISNPEPVTVPNLDAYKLKSKELSPQESQFRNIFEASDKLKNETKSDVSSLLEQLRNSQINLQDYLVQNNKGLQTSLIPQNYSIFSNTPTHTAQQQAGVYSDILGNIETSLQRSLPSSRITSFDNKSVLTSKLLDPKTNLSNQQNLTYASFQDKDEVVKTKPVVRRKRATSFVYEPYKIIRDAQVPDSRKTTTSSNVSPLIRQLQSSKVGDRVERNVDTEHSEKMTAPTRTYKDIQRKDRIKQDKGSKPPEPTIVDIRVDSRRGEPKYEIRLENHKPNYTPVENKKIITVEDYEARTNKSVHNVDQQRQKTTEDPQRTIELSSTPAPYYDLSSFIPKSDIQFLSASNTVKKVVTSAPVVNIKKSSQAKTQKDEDNDDEYEEYEDEETDVTTTTTEKPHFRQRKIKTTSTTEKPEEEEEDQELPRLRLITRFRSTTEYPQKPRAKESFTKKHKETEESPYKEKKHKSRKSTLVTDTKSYGGGDEDMMKDEVDAMIGVQHDMDEYKPSYEKEYERRPSNDEDDNEESDEEENDDEDEDDDDDDDDDDDYEEDEEEESEDESISTTSEPNKSVLVRTTETPIQSTTEAFSAKLEIKPIVTKKKIEIHKELPVNNSSPHVTQFKQDIKEIEIIKELPRRVPLEKLQVKPQKNLEALELYKDEELPKEINKLEAVEIFKANLNLKSGPRHGGNYKAAPSAELKNDVISSSTTTISPKRRFKASKDAETSQSEPRKAIESGNSPRRQRGRQRFRTSVTSSTLELDEPEKLSQRSAHGGNLKSISATPRRRNTNANAKLIELVEDEEDDDSPRSMHGGNFKPYDSSESSDTNRYSGNKRSAKIVQASKDDDSSKLEHKAKIDKSSTNARNNAAVVLSSFAQAVPILTTTPSFILDPSKRMYYYADP